MKMGHTVLDLLFMPPFLCKYSIDNMSSAIRKSNLYPLRHPFVIGHSVSPENVRMYLLVPKPLQTIFDNTN